MDHICDRCECKCTDDAEGHTLDNYWLCDSCYNMFQDWVAFGKGEE